MQNIFIKSFFIHGFYLIAMLVLFTCFANGINFLLMDTMFFFFSYPSFPITSANPLYILFPAVFVCFSFPSVLIFSQQSQLNLKKRMFLLLESHAFFFMIQVLFWALFCYVTLNYAENFLRFLLGANQKADASLAAIFMPLIAVNMLPLFAMFFLWISVKTSLCILRDEEKQVTGNDKTDETGTLEDKITKINGSDSFAFSTESILVCNTEIADNDTERFMFTAEISPQIETGFFLQEWGNIFLLFCMLAMFTPFAYVDFIPALSTHPMIFLFVFLQYYLVRLYKNEKRRSLLLLGTVVQFGIFCFSQYYENLPYRIVFLFYFVSQCCSFFYFYRYGKAFFSRN